MKYSKLTYWFLALLVLAVIAWTGYEITTWHNTLGIGRLLLVSAVIGVAAGLTFGYFLSKSFSDQIDRIRVMAFCLFGGLILFLAGGSFLNRALAKKSGPETVVFQKLEAFGASRFGQLQDSVAVDGYYLYFQLDGEPHRVRLQEPYPVPEEGGTMLLPIRKGFFGVDLVDLK